jgi:hypothetical protein
MKVRCVSLPPTTMPSPFLEAGYTQRTQFHVTAHRIYEVAGVGVITGTICYLISDDTRLPNWLPAALFEVVDSAVGSNWHLVYYHRETRLPGVIDAMIADADIALDPHLPDALMNRDPAALKRFEIIVSRQ